MSQMKRQIEPVEGIKRTKRNSFCQFRKIKIIKCEHHTYLVYQPDSTKVLKKAQVCFGNVLEETAKFVQKKVGTGKKGGKEQE